MSHFPRPPPRSSHAERERTQFLLGDFQAQGSAGLELLHSLYPFELSRSALISLATVFSELIDVPLERDIKRRKELLIKWFDVNISAVKPWAARMTLDISTYSEALREQNSHEAPNHNPTTSPTAGDGSDKAIPDTIWTDDGWDDIAEQVSSMSYSDQDLPLEYL